MEEELVVEFSSFRLYVDGRIDRLQGEDVVPPSSEAAAGVRSKDVVLSPRTGLSARIFLPHTPGQTRKLPLVVFLHGGAFCVETPFSARYHYHALAIAEEAGAVVLSLHYRRAPKHPLPAAYDDVWEALGWAGDHSGGSGPEAWLNDHADLGRAFLVGVSAGATLAHFVTRQAGLEGGPGGLRIAGLVLVHPFFINAKVTELLRFIYPTNAGLEDPRMNPVSDPELGRLGCGKVLVLVAEKDPLKERGLSYCEALKESEWEGELEMFDSKGEGHVFHVSDPQSFNARAIMNKLVSFLTCL